LVGQLRALAHGITAKGSRAVRVKRNFMAA
jgi:hypothetical protein